MPTTPPPRTPAPIPTARLSASHLPPEVEPAERDFMRLLERALSPSFTLVKRLGAGGMGSVYLARDPVLKRLVAVKLMSPQLAADIDARARFEREAQAVASITHPNVVSVYSVGELENGVPYLVMQYVEGRTIADRLKEDGPFDARTAKRVLGEVASALAAAHKKGIIHRDIKPANIIWDDDSGRVLVTDFGIAAVLERGDVEREPTKITHTGMAIGTPAYMSPEQLLAEPVTEKTDIYSLGLLGYELFIADGPYQVSSPREIMAAHLRDTPRKLSAMRADADPELERLLEACLAKDPKQRPSAAEVEKRLLHGTAIVLEWPPPGLENFGREARTTFRVLLAGAWMAGLPIALVALFDRESFVRQTLPPMGVLLSISFIGLLVFWSGLLGVWRFASSVRKSVRSGFGWSVVLEAGADLRGDTGALIAGAREYAELEPRARSWMRRLRLTSFACRFVAALTPIVGFALGVQFFGGTPEAPTIVLWSSVLLSFTLLAVAEIINRQEDRAMAPARRRMRTAAARPGNLGNLAESWMTTFEQVREGQSLGPGSTRWAKPARYALAAVLILSAAMGLGLFLLAGFSTAISIELRTFIGAPNLRARLAQTQRLIYYRLPADTSITALRAGQSLVAIANNGPRSDLKTYEKAPAISIPPQHRDWTRMPAPPFTGAWEEVSFKLAAKGFTAAQREYLKTVADNTALEEFRILARAKDVDVGGALWDIDPNVNTRWFDLPIPRFAALRAAANANVAQAALDLESGNRAQAERRLRENVSVGFLMIESGHMLIETLMGAAILRASRPSLAAFYEATGRARDAAFAAQDADPAFNTVESIRGTNLTPEEKSRQLRRVILDDKEIPGLRWEALMMDFAIEPCADIHQLIFGADELQRQTLTAAKQKMAKRGTDSLLFLMLERANGIVPPAPLSPKGQSQWTRHVPTARIVSALTGSRQLEACMLLLP